MVGQGDNSLFEVVCISNEWGPQGEYAGVALGPTIGLDDWTVYLLTGMGADEATLDWYATWVTLKEGTSRPLFGVDACQDKANLIKIDEYTSVLTVTATNDQNQTLDVTVTWEYRDDEYSYGYFYTYGGHKIDVMSRIPPTSELVLMACNGTIVSYDPSLEPYGTHWRGAGEA